MAMTSLTRYATCATASLASMVLNLRIMISLCDVAAAAETRNPPGSGGADPPSFFNMPERGGHGRQPRSPGTVMGITPPPADQNTLFSWPCPNPAAVITETGDRHHCRKG